MSFQCVMRNIGMTHWKDITYDGLLLTVYVGWPP
jgi:hypothetical protein